ncbi:hypothetical protein F4861DRAFT_506440 [Xylaria intraflava]|nr:hypothetical protein F4861DRAFT_506440 [Xylaria intraflava]
MDRTPVEIFYAIASQLKCDDLVNFRLANKLFASIGATYLLPEVTFCMHQSDLRRLEAISLHPIFSKHVRTLTYCAEALHSPRLSWLHFVRDQGMEIRFPTKPSKCNLPPTQFLLEYQKYCEALTKQDQLIEARADLAVLREVLPRLPNLDTFTMSAGLLFDEGHHWTRRKSPFADFIASSLTNGIHPEGKLQLETLLMANAHVPCALKSLRAGSLHWEFFNQHEETLTRMFQPLANLTSLELSVNADPIKVGMFELHPQGANNPLRRCRAALAKGGIRKALASLPRLQSLHVDLLSLGCDQPEKGAWLRDIIEPGFHWPDLKELMLGGFMSSRTELTNVLMIHKDTLQKLCLRNVSLASTSWRQLLPDIRNYLHLEDACICGTIHGQDENQDELDTEHWHLSMPEIRSHDNDDMMRNSINMYCRQSGEYYPNEIPLSESVVDQYYDTHVKPFFDHDILFGHQEGGTNSGSLDEEGTGNRVDDISDNELEDDISHGTSTGSLTRDSDEFLAFQMMMAGVHGHEEGLQRMLNDTVDNGMDRQNVFEGGMGPPPWLMEATWFADDDEDPFNMDSETDSEDEMPAPNPQ